MSDNLRDRIAAALKAEDESLYICPFDGEPTMASYDRLADAVIRELTEAIPPIVASAIQGYAQSELVAISHHGEASEYEAMKRLDREAMRIARYATTHEDWNG